ncbi:MAG: hypothetical protein J5509_04740 [Lachnospiraceae bacterium]|nr:hypothetical protein [Lachnospiraceae bacterium]
MIERLWKKRSDYYAVAVIPAVVICFLIMNDNGNIAAIRHLAAIFLISFFMRPYMGLRTIKFPDGGFGISFGLGAFLCFYPAWLISSTGICKYSDPIIFISFLVLACLGYVIKRFVLKETYITPEEAMQTLKGFAAFAVIFLLFFWIIGFNPLIDPGTENYMDYGFIRTIYRQKTAIPYDIWFAGEKLNYYYLGQSICVYLIRLGLNTPEYGYNMMLATFIGMVFIMVYELICGITNALLPDMENRDKLSSFGGMAGAVLAAFGANPHWLLYGIVYPLIGKTYPVRDYGYWFSDPTTYISSALGDPDNGKNEFPAYSVILGDLHAHVINLMFVLPLLALLFDHCLPVEDDEDENEKRGLYKLILISMLLGYFKGSNYWDFAIYFVITGAVVLTYEISRKGIGLKAFCTVTVKAVIVIVVSLLVPLPFTLNFKKMVTGIAFSDVHSPFGKFLVLWFISIAVTIGLAAYILYSQKHDSEINPQCGACLLALSVCAIGLTLTPEVLYIKDIYTEGYHRFNTMFKLTYQAYVLFAIITGIVFAILLYELTSGNKRRVLKCAGVIGLTLYVLLSATYTGYAVNQWYGNVLNSDARLGISSLEGLRDDPDYGFELQAMDYLDKDDKQVLNIIEAAADNYTHQGALSVYSGACTPIGWFTHEWMWHDDYDTACIKTEQVELFYMMGDEDYCKEILRQYDIDYIFVGPTEVSKYYVDTAGFSDLGEAVISTEWKGVNLMLIKVDKSKL